MTQTLYFNIRLIFATLSIVLGAVLLWGSIPKKLRGSVFDTSRKCIALAIMVMPLATFITYFLSLRLSHSQFYVVLYLTACYVISILVTVGFVPLLGGGKFNFRQWRFVRGVISIPFFSMLMICAQIYNDPVVVDIARIVTIALLAITVAYQSYIFYKFYKKAVRRGNNYYSEDIEVDINWIIRSVVAFFIMEMVCALSTFFVGMGLVAELMLTLYRVGTLVYVFLQFVSFMRNFETMMTACVDLQHPILVVAEVKEENEIEAAEVVCKTLSGEQRMQIAARLENWVSKKGYQQNGITINDVASEAATNRTYLSAYINTTYECSFKVWVTSLRIERAKELLLGDDTAIEISRMVGFSSSQSFMHSFKRSEGCTPTEWRVRNKESFRASNKNIREKVNC